MRMNLKRLVLCLLSLIGFCSGLHLPRFFQDGMILQASGQRSIRTIWGFLDGLKSNVTLMGRCQLQNGDSFQVQEVFEPELDYEFWFNTNIVEGTKCDFTIFQEGVSESLSLLEVTFGDVWICSGQSNMGWAMRGIFNLEEELARLAQNYPNFRFITVAKMANETVQDDLMMDDDEVNVWSSTSVLDEKKVRAFSSVCILTASYMADVLGKNKTFGLIQSAWAGTRIESWYTNFPNCDIEDNIDENKPWFSNRYLYNAMIHPLFRSGIKGVLWYQGESNANWNRDRYQCSIKQLIQDWKDGFQGFGTLVDERMPFGIVQLSTSKQDNDPSTPMIRWHQTADYGYLPNEMLPNTFLALSLDTYDEDRLHPRNKQLPSRRLACSGLNMAYGLKEWPLNGPFPETITFNQLPDGIQVDILMDQDFVWNNNETNGFAYCCTSTLTECNAELGQWKNVETLSLNGRAFAMVIPACSIGIAYLWETTPVLATEGLPIYAADQFSLPAAPWMRPIEFE